MGYMIIYVELIITRAPHSSVLQKILINIVFRSPPLLVQFQEVYLHVNLHVLLKLFHWSKQNILAAYVFYSTIMSGDSLHLFLICASRRVRPLILLSPENRGISECLSDLFFQVFVFHSECAMNNVGEETVDPMKITEMVQLLLKNLC